MANTKRRENYIDRDGNMFMPMSIEGSNWNENFITTPKLACIVGIILSIFVIILYLNSVSARVGGYLFCIGIWFIASTLVLRFVIFEEKTFYKMYKELQLYKISTPALFWNIATIKDTDEGAILTYADGKIAILVKLDRDTITGKSKEFVENHYDAISDFYREVVTNKYSMVQMNIMEQAGKDPRLNELNKLVYKSDNANIVKLMELEVGYIKTITRKALYESDYFLFYTNDLSKIDIIIQDISECIFKILDGAYSGFSILSSKEIVDIEKESYGVSYFNSTQASLMMFNRTSGNIPNPFNITGIVWDDNTEQVLNNREISKINSIASYVISGAGNMDEVSLKDALYRKENKNKINSDLGELTLDDTELKDTHKDFSNMTIDEDEDDYIEI